MKNFLILLVFSLVLMGCPDSQRGSSDNAAQGIVGKLVGPSEEEEEVLEALLSPEEEDENFDAQQEIDTNFEGGESPDLSLIIDNPIVFP